MIDFNNLLLVLSYIVPYLFGTIGILGLTLVLCREVIRCNTDIEDTILGISWAVYTLAYGICSVLIVSFTRSFSIGLFLLMIAIVISIFLFPDKKKEKKQMNKNDSISEKSLIIGKDNKDKEQETLKSLTGLTISKKTKNKIKLFWIIFKNSCTLLLSIVFIATTIILWLIANKYEFQIHLTVVAGGFSILSLLVNIVIYNYLFKFIKRFLEL